MASRFLRYSLGSLAIQLELEVRKVNSSDLSFDCLWYTASESNRSRMVKYSIADCDTNRCLLDKLAIIPQICTICYAASVTLEDVCLYQTDTIAASALAKSADKSGMTYSWTRCDWIPEVFKIGRAHV